MYSLSPPPHPHIKGEGYSGMDEDYSQTEEGLFWIYIGQSPKIKKLLAF
jgi:hypothetical protein